jgi:hypothetical protein
MMVYTSGTKRVRFLWGLVCESWGVHAVAQLKEDLVAENRKWKIAETSCAPHRIVKLVPTRTHNSRER